LAHVLTTLNRRYDYGLELFLLSIDEGIKGYRDDSLEVRMHSHLILTRPQVLTGLFSSLFIDGEEKPAAI
jgi:hypothetical protein